MTNERIKALNALSVEAELRELDAVFGPLKAVSVRSKGITKEVVKLKRSFNMTMDGVTLRFWRVVGPQGHPNYHSDLSLAGLKEWRII
jgi:hypothetical protein